MRVLIADPHKKTRRALSLLLHEEQGVSAICEAFDAECTLQLAAEETIDLVLLDEELPGSPIKNLIDELHFLIPAPKIIVMTNDLEKGRLFLRNGANAFISKSDPPDWLLSTLRGLIEPIEE